MTEINQVQRSGQIKFLSQENIWTNYSAHHCDYHYCFVFFRYRVWISTLGPVILRIFIISLKSSRQMVKQYLKLYNLCTWHSISKQELIYYLPMVRYGLQRKRKVWRNTQTHRQKCDPPNKNYGGGGKQTRKEQGDLISILYFFK